MPLRLLHENERPTMSTGHAKRSPSKSKQFINCPGSLMLSEALPEFHRDVAGPAAQRGTATHGLIERCLKEGKEAADYKDRIIELIGEEEAVSILRPGAKVPGPGRVFFIVDDDMIDDAATMIGYVRKRCAELGVPESELQLETRTNPLPERDDTSGTADVTIDAWPDVLEVVDYKNGYITVDHEDNTQTQAYLTGKAVETEWSHERYRITIVQPNADHSDGAIRSVDFTAKELKAFQKRYRAANKRCDDAERDPDAPKPGFRKLDTLWSEAYLAAGDHCLFCVAAPVCPARIAMAQAEAGVDFEDEPHDLPEPLDYTTAARILEWAPRMEALIRQANMFVQRGLENGDHVPGFKLVRGRSYREWRPDMTERQIIKHLMRDFGLDPVDLYQEPKIKSGPQIEKLIPAEAREAFNEKLLYKPLGRLTVAPESDPREAVLRTAADDFDDEEFDF